MGLRTLIGTLFSLSLAAACSATDPAPAGGGGGSTAASTSSASGSPSSSTGTQDCTTQSGHAACVSCCVMQNSSGAHSYDSSLVSHCACATGTTCNAQCSGQGYVCQSSDASMVSQGCISCLDGIQSSDACESDFEADCQKNSDCVNFVNCASSCPM